MNATDFLSSIEFPMLFFASHGHPAGNQVPLGLDGYAATEDGNFDVTNLEGTVDGDGAWRWDGQSGEPCDWTRNDCYQLSIFNDEKSWKSAAVDFATCDGETGEAARSYLVGQCGFSQAEADEACEAAW